MRAHTHRLVLIPPVCALSSCHHRASVGCKSSRHVRRQSVFTKFRGHDPFIVRSAQTCPPFTGFTQLAHPSRCSRSTVFTSGLCPYREQLNCRTRVCSVSHNPSDAMSRMIEIEAAQNIDDRRTSHSITGKHYPNFKLLDAKNATASKNVLMLTNVKKTTHLEERRKPKEISDFFEDDRSLT